MNNVLGGQYSPVNNVRGEGGGGRGGGGGGDIFGGTLYTMTTLMKVSKLHTV